MEKKEGSASEHRNERLEEKKCSVVSKEERECFIKEKWINKFNTCKKMK